MTMNTRLHIAKPVNPEALFLHLLGILESDPSFVPAWEKPPEPPFVVTPGPLRLGRATYKHVRKGDLWRNADGEVIWLTTTGEPLVEDESQYRSTPRQNLAATLAVTYGSDGPFVWPPLDSGEEPGPMQTYLVDALFESGYGTEMPNGADCADLHAFLLRETKRHLDAQGVDEWVWHHEENGTWHQPEEYPLRGNADLAAANWGVQL